jgi:hypothetical protein
MFDMIHGEKKKAGIQKEATTFHSIFGFIVIAVE